MAKFGKKNTLQTRSTVSMQEYYTILIGKLCLLHGMKGKSTFLVSIINWFSVDKIKTVIFHNIWQLRHINGGLYVSAPVFNGDLLSYNLYHFAVVLYELFGKMLFMLWHGLKGRNTFLE